MKKNFIIIFIFVLILEIFVFNFQSYRILTTKNKVEFQKENFSVYEKKDGYVYVELDDIFLEIKTLHIMLENVNNITSYEVFYTDATTSEFKYLAEKNYINDVEKTKYLNTFLSGKTEKIAIKIYDENIDIENICINDKIPFEFNFFRFIILYLILISIYIIRKSDIFKVPYARENLKHEFILFISVILFCGIMCYINYYSNDNRLDIYSFDFVNSLANGKLYLSKEPSQELLNLENPYDTLSRIQNNIEVGKDYYWDTALYNNKLYVYFGILPEIILLLPFHLITNTYLLSSTAIIIFSCLTCFSIKKLLQNIFMIYFKNIPFKFLLYSLLILLFGSQILVLNGAPRMYELLIISGLFFAITGINFMFSAIKQDKIYYRYIVLSTLFLSLAVACRPTMLMVSFIAMPFFIKIILNNIREKKELLKTIISIFSPYIVIGGLLMYYNYIRFDSIFEFGSSYQLTVNDMLNLKKHIMCIGTGLICNLFGTLNLSPSFPFLSNNNNLANFYGYYYIEDMIGGLFILVPICFFIFLIWKILKKSQNRKNCFILLDFFIVGIIMCIVEFVVAGSVPRYLADYGWILIMAGIMSFLELYNIYKSDEAKSILENILKILVIYTLIINFCAGIISEEHNFEIYSPVQYNKLKYSINFWE